VWVHESLRTSTSHVSAPGAASLRRKRQTTLVTHFGNGLCIAAFGTKLIFAEGLEHRSIVYRDRFQNMGHNPLTDP
jgi:hypothetical protein